MRRNEPVRKPTHEDKVWTAGFLDGDGSFHLHVDLRPRVPYRRPIVTAPQHVREPLEFLAARWGGSVHLHKGNHIWRWEVSGHLAEVCARDVLPFLKVKADNAKRMLRHEPSARQRENWAKRGVEL